MATFNHCFWTETGPPWNTQHLLESHSGVSLAHHLLLHPGVCQQVVKVGGRALPCPALHEVISPCIPPFFISHRCPTPNLPPSFRPVQHKKGTVSGPCTTFSLFIPGRQTRSQQPCPSPDLACPTAAAAVEAEVAPCP
jgi:hypothetical protein